MLLVSHHSQVALAVKNLPANAGDVRDGAQSLVQEDAPEEGMETHSSILAWEIAWTEELVAYSPWGHKESDTTERLSLLHYCICGTLWLTQTHHIYCLA